MNDKADAHELSELLTYLKNNPDDEYSILLLESQIESHKLTDTGDKEFWKEKLMNILTQMPVTQISTIEPLTLDIQRAGTPPGRHTPLFRKMWLRYAAAVIFIFGTGFYLLVPAKKNKEVAVMPKKTIVDVPPGKYGAVLTLADGSALVLDSMHNGIVATQGNAHAILNKGRLSYIAQHSDGEPVLYNTMSTLNGRQFQLTLPDGTMVWLNDREATG